MEDGEGLTIGHCANNDNCSDSGVWMVGLFESIHIHGLTEKSLQGTTSFIAIELLMFGAPHHVVHDSESVFFVLLFICTHLDGPYSTIHDPPLYGPMGKEHPSPMRHWLTMNTFSVLGHLKHSHMSCHFEEVILPHISPYFEPLKLYLKALWGVLHPQQTTVLPVLYTPPPSPSSVLAVLAQS